MGGIRRRFWFWVIFRNGDPNSNRLYLELYGAVFDGRKRVGKRRHRAFEFAYSYGLLGLGWGLENGFRFLSILFSKNRLKNIRLTDRDLLTLITAGRLFFAPAY